MVNLNEMAYVIADGNYVKITYIAGMKSELSLGLSKFYEMIVKSYDVASTCPFVKLGRSVIINQHYLYDINILKQRLTLSDNTHTHQIQMPKQLLKSYRDMIINAQKVQK